MKLALIAGIALLLFAGCYHATIETGASPSTTVYKQAWASSWVYGLVPPKTVEAQAKCPGGVSRVETKLSFLNQLVGFLTIGIYTPMEITVTCAGSGTADVDAPEIDIVCKTGTNDAIEKAFAEAATKSVELGRPVYVQIIDESEQLEN
ncbi:MAG: Bor family protein [Candidatus Zixiibacteriota bacterium]